MKNLAISCLTFIFASIIIATAAIQVEEVPTVKPVWIFNASLPTAYYSSVDADISQPVTDGELVFFTHGWQRRFSSNPCNMTVTAVSAATGKVRWQTPLGAQLFSARGSISVAHGVLVFSGTMHQGVFSLNASTGAILFEHPLPRPNPRPDTYLKLTGPVITKYGILVLAHNYSFSTDSVICSLKLLNPTTGDVIYEKHNISAFSDDINDGPQTSTIGRLAVSDDESTVFLVSQPGLQYTQLYIAAYDVSTGTQTIAPKLIPGAAGNGVDDMTYWKDLDAVVLMGFYNSFVLSAKDLTLISELSAPQEGIVYSTIFNVAGNKAAVMNDFTTKPFPGTQYNQPALIDAKTVSTNATAVFTPVGEAWKHPQSAITFMLLNPTITDPYTMVYSSLTAVFGVNITSGNLLWKSPVNSIPVGTQPINEPSPKMPIAVAKGLAFAAVALNDSDDYCIAAYRT